MRGRYLPTLPQITSEALAVIAGAIIAAAVLSQFPQLRAWIKSNTGA
jgi:hypothetical protein